MKKYRKRLIRCLIEFFILSILIAFPYCYGVDVLFDGRPYAKPLPSEPYLSLEEEYLDIAKNVVNGSGFELNDHVIVTKNNGKISVSYNNNYELVYDTSNNTYEWNSRGTRMLIWNIVFFVVVSLFWLFFRFTIFIDNDCSQKLKKIRKWKCKKCPDYETCSNFDLKTCSKIDEEN